MARAPAFQFYPNDYIRDTRILSLKTRGAWADLLSFMWFAENRGELEGSYQQFARMLACSESEVKEVFDELSVTKTATVTNCNGILKVVNRRMFREEKERKSTRLRVQKHRNARKDTDCNAFNTPLSSSSPSSSPSGEIKNLGENYVLPSQEEIENYSPLKLQEEIEVIVNILYEQDIFPESYAFTNTVFKENKNTKSILWTLIQCYQYRPQKPWAYCRKIINLENLNWNERDNTRASQ